MLPAATAYDPHWRMRLRYATAQSFLTCTTPTESKRDISADDTSRFIDVLHGTDVQAELMPILLSGWSGF